MLEKMNAYISEPIQGAFKNAFNSTGVNVRIVAINQDGSPIDPNKAERQNVPEAEPETVPTEEKENEEQKMLELEAKAKLELMKYRIKLAKKKKGLEGLSGIELQKLKYFKQRMQDLNGIADVWDFK